MKLLDVYETPGAYDVLWVLLGERQPSESISHRSMPEWRDHAAFVASRPYEAWYLIEVEGFIRGACYLTTQREIGIGILKSERGKGFGLAAVLELMRVHAGVRFLANINPLNEASASLFRKLGFNLIQHTYASA